MSSIIETNLSLRDYRQNIQVKKITSWAALIAVPTLVTGFFGMNVPYPVPAKRGECGLRSCSASFRRRSWCRSFANAAGCSQRHLWLWWKLRRDPRPAADAVDERHEPSPDPVAVQDHSNTNDIGRSTVPTCTSLVGFVKSRVTLCAVASVGSRCT